MFEFETKRSVFGNMEYPIILCEDNPEQLANLTSIINDFNMFHPNQYKLAFKSSDPHAIEDYIKDNSIEKGVYFLDIDLGSDINGIDLAQWVRNHDISGKIIFVTTHTEMAPLTLQRQVEPLGFITKDMGYEQMRIEIVDTLNLAYERIEKKALENDKMYSFSIGNQVLNFEEKKIIYITSSDKAHRVILVTQDGQYEFFDNIANLEKETGLLKVSRSLLVNPKNIERVDYKMRVIYFKNDDEEVFSLSKTKALKQALLNENEE